MHLSAKIGFQRGEVVKTPAHAARSNFFPPTSSHSPVPGERGSLSCRPSDTTVPDGGGDGNADGGGEGKLDGGGEGDTDGGAAGEEGNGSKGGKHGGSGNAGGMGKTGG